MGPPQILWGPLGPSGTPRVTGGLGPSGTHRVTEEEFKLEFNRTVARNNDLSNPEGWEKNLIWTWTFLDAHCQQQWASLGVKFWGKKRTRRLLKVSGTPFQNAHCQHYRRTILKEFECLGILDLVSFSQSYSSPLYVKFLLPDMIFNFLE